MTVVEYRQPWAVTLLWVASFWSVVVSANDVEPRLYSNIPTGINFLSIGYARSHGEVSFDSSVPVADVEGEIDSVVMSYSRGLNIAGKSALLTLAVPYAHVALEGLYLGQPASGRRQGMGDPRIRLVVNFYGAPAMDQGGISLIRTANHHRRQRFRRHSRGSLCRKPGDQRGDQPVECRSAAGCIT
ncbi:MAG: hypothetical protein O7G86_15255 [Gammaproteobacteria bacterium]|nr:hypothetical protein [Gammaproteobacteria bacterium]